jgi:hypothetical protein
LLTIDLNQPFHGYSLSGIPCQKPYSTLCPENWADPSHGTGHFKKPARFFAKQSS